MACTDVVRFASACHELILSLSIWRIVVADGPRNQFELCFWGVWKFILVIGPSLDQWGGVCSQQEARASSGVCVSSYWLSDHPWASGEGSAVNRKLAHLLLSQKIVVVVSYFVFTSGDICIHSVVYL